MTKAFVIYNTGDPERMVWEDVIVGDPGPGQVLLRQTAVGVNYVDVHFRRGFHTPVPLPFIPGVAGAGVVEAVGADVEDLKVNDRVAYASYPVGSYAEARLMPASRLVRVPDSINDTEAASLMLPGMTACCLLRHAYKLQKGETILVHAAAGSVGLMLCQWAKALGATVIGTLGSEEKASVVKEWGCDHVILYQEEDVAERVREFTDGEGVSVVYDSVGRDMLMPSLDSLRPMGMLVNYGSTSGPISFLNINTLGLKGSLYFTRPILATYTAKRSNLLAMAEELFDVVAQGKVKSIIGQTYPLQEAVQAHYDLEARKTIGSIVLTVDPTESQQESPDPSADQLQADNAGNDQ